MAVCYNMKSVVLAALFAYLLNEMKSFLGRHTHEAACSLLKAEINHVFLNQYRLN